MEQASQLQKEQQQQQQIISYESSERFSADKQVAKNKEVNIDADFKIP